MRLLSDSFGSPANAQGQLAIAQLAQHVHAWRVQADIDALEPSCAVSGLDTLTATCAAVSVERNRQPTRGGVVDQPLVGGLLDVGFFGHLISDVAEQCAMFRGQIRNLASRFRNVRLILRQIIGGLFFSFKTLQNAIVRANNGIQVCCAVEFNCPVHLRSPVKFFNERTDYCALFFRDKFHHFVEVCQNLVARERFNVIEHTVYANLGDNVRACGDAAGGIDVGFENFFMFHDASPIRIPGSAGAGELQCASHKLNYTHESGLCKKYLQNNLLSWADEQEAA